MRPAPNRHQATRLAAGCRERCAHSAARLGAPQIGTWTPKGSGGGGRSGGRGSGVAYRRAWGISVKRDDDAYLWARWLAPVYSVMVANVKAALRLQVRAGCTLGGGGRGSWRAKRA